MAALEDEGPQPSLIQSKIDTGAIDEEDENVPQISQADLIRNKVAMCSECKSVLPDSQVEDNVFYQSGQPMPCPFCGGVVAIVPEALASTKYFHNRLDQLRGIGTTGYIPGVTAD